jgi:peptide/nickel transport system substrate-binding protein
LAERPAVNASPLILLACTGLALGCALAACSPHPERQALTILIPGDILSLDPNRDLEQVTDSVLFNVFEPLVGLNENLELRTILAESWEHPRPEQWRFHLRRGVRFHDGTPLTASLVRDCFLALRRGANRDAADFLSALHDIVAVDENTLDLVTSTPRAILSNLLFLYVTKPNTAGAFPPLLGTGPYRIREWERSQRVVLEARPDGGNHPVTFKQVTYLPVADARARFERVAKGDADVAYGVPSGLAARPAAGLRVVRHPGLTVFYLGFNLRHTPDNPFRDLRVRQAFDLALDRKRFVDPHLTGRGSVPTQPIAPVIFGFNPELPPPLYDPGRARQLLAEAGYPAGFKKRLEILDTRLPIARLVQDALRGIGVEIEPHGLPGDQFWDFLRSAKSELFLMGWSCATGEASEFYEFVLHTRTSLYGRGNYGGYSSPLVDRVAETNTAVLDQRNRRQLLQEAAAAVMQDLPLIPLYIEHDLYAVRDGIEFAARADGEIRLLDLRRSGR